jgi:hypothetical protein
VTTLNPGGTAPFNLTWLGDALARRMAEIFADFRLASDHPDAQPQETSVVTVYLGSIKSRARANDGTEAGPAFPLVVVRPRTCTDDNGEDGAQRSSVAVDFVIGARRIGNDGYLDVTAILERIRTNLLRSPLVEARARMELPLESEIGEDEAFPQWFGIVSARFNIPQPVEEIPNE